MQIVFSDEADVYAKIYESDSDYDYDLVCEMTLDAKVTKASLKWKSDLPDDVREFFY